MSSMKEPPPTSKQQFQPFLVSLISSLGIWASDVVLYPLDTISTRIKSHHNQTHRFWTYTRQMMQNEGNISFFRGISLTLHATFLPSVIYFYMYERLMRVVKNKVDDSKRDKHLQLIFPFFVSAFSQLVSLTVLLPFDTLRTRFQVNDPRYKYEGIRHGLKQVMEQQGFMRFYASSKLYMVNMSLFTGIQFQIYQMLRFGDKQGSILKSVQNSVIATWIATTICSPLDLMITRYALVDTTKKELNFKKMVKKIIQKEGYRGFFKGYVPRVLNNCGYTACWFPLYEYVRTKFGIQMID